MTTIVIHYQKDKFSHKFLTNGGEMVMMKRKNTIFAIISAILPVAVSEIVQKAQIEIPNFVKAIISFCISFLILWIAQSILNKYNRLNIYCSQWVEEMTQYNEQGESTEKFIGIGIIHHDLTTDEHTFIGKTYTLSGNEKFSWSIDYLRADKDSSMQYVCLVQNPLERSIGQITFHSRNECEGLIWCMNSVSYKYNAYRITKKMLIDLELSKLLEKRFYTPFFKGMIVSQRNCPEFVQRYSADKFK